MVVRGLVKEKKNYKSEWLAASFTVEASLIMPIAVLVIILMVSITFYLHDVVTLESIVYEGWLYEEREKEEELKAKAQQQTFFTSQIEFTAEEHQFTKEISCTAQINFLGNALIHKVKNDDFLRYSKSLEGIKISGPDLIRLCNASVNE